MGHPISLSASIDFWTHYRASRAVIARTWNTYLAWAFFFGVPALLVIVLLVLHQDIAQPGLFGWPTWMLPIIGIRACRAHPQRTKLPPAQSRYE